MHIDSYQFGRIVIDGKEYTHDLIIYPDYIDAGWFRKEGHTVSTEDIAPILKLNPKRLIIGTGYSGFVNVLPEVSETCKKVGTELIIQPTGVATKRYNNTKDCIAAFHLTC